LGKIAATNVGGVQGNRGIAGEVRRFLRERLRMPRDCDGARVKIQPPVCPGETLEQPAAKESRGARDQDAARGI
jgi:hypothetical protein